jgi:predicted lipoprotein with Yx(FWY)xxD motif
MLNRAALPLVFMSGGPNRQAGEKDPLMNMKFRGALVVGALAVLALAGCSQASGAGGYGSSPSSSPTSSSSGSSSSGASSGSAMSGSSVAALSTATSSLGTIVVDGTGMTVYVFDNDTANSGKSTCEGNCSATWPAVTTTGVPTEQGVTGKLGTITLPDGAKQVTLDGLPLYRYAPDSAAGDVNGQGVGGIWWVVGSNGVKITSAASGGGY